MDDVQPSWLSPESESRRNDSSSTAIRTYNLYDQKKGTAPAPPSLVLVERVPIGKAAVEGSGSSTSASANGGTRWTLLPDPGTRPLC